MFAGNGQAAGHALSLPLLTEERKRMELLHHQVASLTEKLVGMERRVAGQPDVEENYEDRDASPVPQHSEASPHTKRHRWKRECMESEDDFQLAIARTRRPLQDFFIDVMTIFDYLLPGWDEASIDAAGILELHAGPYARMVPFMAILLVVPASMVLPIANLRQVFQKSAAGFKDRLICLVRLALVTWLAWCPVLYWVFGNPIDDAQRHRTTFLSFSFPWWALAWLGYSIANDKLCSACDKAVERKKVEVVKVRHQHQKAACDGLMEGEAWIASILEALADPDAGNSLYPMFACSESLEPKAERLSASKHMPIMALVTMQVMYALYPCVDADWRPWALVSNLTSAVAIGYTTYCFCYDLGVKMAEFKDCVDEIRTFLFMVAPPEVRMSRRRRDEFLSLLVENITNRRQFTERTDGGEIKAPSEAWEKKIRDLSKRNRSGLLDVKDELDLEVRRVELNLSTVPGVALFQHLHGWVLADVVNERFGIDTSASIMCVMLVMLMGVSLAPVLFSEQLVITRVSMTQGVAFIDILGMLIYIGLCCNYCVEMNGLLFQHSDGVLMQWKDHARLPRKTVARTWLDKEKRVKDWVAPITTTQGESTFASHTFYHGPMEVRAMIDLTRERLGLQAPQEILGMKVTPALRAKLLSTLGTGIAAVAISMLKKHFGDVGG